MYYVLFNPKSGNVKEKSLFRLEKYFKKIIITNEDDIVALYSQEKNSIIININKIIKELIYRLAFKIYEELVLSGLIFGAFPKTALMIILLSSPFAIFLSLLTSIFKRKVNVVISYVLTIG